MKSVMISIKPYWVFLIIAKTMGWAIDKQKTVEVRKTYPQDDEWNKVGKIYCTKDKKSFNHIPKKYQPFMEKFLGKSMKHNTYNTPQIRVRFLLPILYKSYTHSRYQ